jgi:hypothetical protein
MRTLAVLAMTASVAGLSGCVSHPLTAQEFRAAVPGSFSGAVEEFEVNRSVEEIGKTFERKGPECLAVTIETTSSTNMSYQHYTTTYKPSVVRDADKAELHLQQHHSNTVNVSKEPDGGYFLLVVDAERLDKKRSRITLYKPKFGFDVLVRSVKGWATGESMGCPDMTKI